MRLRLREVVLGLDEEEGVLAARVAATLAIAPQRIRNLRVVRRAIDARKKPKILRVFTVEFELAPGAAGAPPAHPRLEVVVPPAAVRPVRCRQPHWVLVAGMGPAGLFAALQLARSGCEVQLIERGRPVEARVKDVRQFWRKGRLDPESNVLFGEGGAGTFSDGKLTTRVNHPGMRRVLETLVECGAGPEILTEAKPHIGTERLRLVLINFRRRLAALGVTLEFETRLAGLVCRGHRVVGAHTGDGRELTCDSLVLAPGHSARDTYRMLAAAGVRLESKPFAVGVRVEHPADLIDRIQYGRERPPGLPAGDYALAWNDPDSGRGVYSFCMCPGGEVIICASEEGGLVVNGMSYGARAGAWSNSALVVSVRPEDFQGGNDPLAGIAFQRRWETAAFRAGGGAYRAPAQNLLAFAGQGRGPVRATCRPGILETDLNEVLPDFATTALRRALPHFERRMRGFLSAEATLVGVETRTSAPVRVVRDATGRSLSHAGLYPAGEGAGYAGGIMSAALDGLRVAEGIIQRVNDRSAE